jgi:hypothetical protein
MAMPAQLRNSNRRRPRHFEPPPIIELMPTISIHELRHAIPRHYGAVNQPDVSLKYPDLDYMRLSASCLEIMGRNGYVQRFAITWIPTHFGKHRAILVCNRCHGGAIRLFGKFGSYACRFCHRARYLSQRQSSQGRKRLAAAKLRLTELGSVPNINQPIAQKPKRKHRKRHQAICNQIRALEAKAKQTRFRKEIDIRTLAYHV